MHIAMGMHLQEGSFGGGNQFGTLLSFSLRAQGHRVSFNLRQPDLDLILMTDPRPYLSSVAFGPIDILRYLRRTNPNTIVVHRVNECDERKETHGLNALLARANHLADHTVYVGSWLPTLFARQHLAFTPASTVILNGADPSVFHYTKHAWNPDHPLRLVTHHWSSHWMKGWDVYQALDHLLDDPDMRALFSLDYIGNIPRRLQLKHITVHPPTSGRALAALLGTFDAYITASQFEPGANHPVEAALCGLPLLYRDSGSLPEYCEGYGERFSSPEDVLPALCRLKKRYAMYTDKLAHYPLTHERTCRAYTNLFGSLLANKSKLQPSRDPHRYGMMTELNLHAAILKHRFDTWRMRHVV
jgi:hypothetical protein